MMGFDGESERSAVPNAVFAPGSIGFGGFGAPAPGDTAGSVAVEGLGLKAGSGGFGAVAVVTVGGMAVGVPTPVCAVGFGACAAAAGRTACIGLGVSAR